MARAVSSANIKKRLDIALKREAAIAAKKASSTAKEWKAQDPTTDVLCNQINNLKAFVKIPVVTTNLDKIPAATQEALGMMPGGSTLTALGAGSIILPFKGNHKLVCRITVHPGLVTPISKNTSWGTRVTKFTDKSWSFPAGGASIPAIQTAFRAAFASGGAMAPQMGTPNGHGFATLHINGAMLDIVTS
ncbi:MAG: hypothetical protein WBL95_04480 [Microcoleus sp.]